MKKTTLTAIVLSFVLVAPAFVLADESTDALIARLRQQIAELTAQLAVLQKTQSEMRPWCHTFTTNLKIGDRNEEVSALQFALQKEGFSIDAGELAGETNYDVGTFGESTAAAVTGFQEKYRSEILTPLGLAHGTGYVGKSTRAKLNQLYGCGNIAPTTSQIYSIYPQSGPVHTEVTLTGTGFVQSIPPPPDCGNPPYPCDWFMATNTIRFGPATISNIPSADGRTLTFTVPDGWSSPCSGNQCPAMYGQITPGTYKVAVENVNGMSNNVLFTVTSPSVASESVKCVFNNATTEQQCYSSDGQYAFSGVGTAGGVVSGASGTKITWKSSCGGYAYTTIDGANEYANFYCGATQSSIRVLSPNGGEIFTQGEKNIISWSGGKNKVQVGVVNADFDPASPSELNGILGWITLDGSPNDSAYWDAKSVCSTPGDTCWPILLLSPGPFKIIAVSESDFGNYCIWSMTPGVCNMDLSDAPFSIVGGKTGNLPPSINGVSGPTVLKAGEVGKWEVRASDPERGPLSYSVVWGEEVPTTISERAVPSVMGAPAQTATFTHVYSQAGVFSPIFTVTDGAGLSAKTSVSVNVSGGTTGNNPPSINGVPAIPSNIQVGQSVSFTWNATDADNDNLSWSVSWGDGSAMVSACPIPNPQNRQGWAFSTSHAWAASGTYLVRATVGDCRGGSDENSFTVTVGLVVEKPFVNVLSPNGGEVFYQDQMYGVSWSAPTGYFAGIFASPVNGGADVLVSPTYAQMNPPFKWLVPASVLPGDYRMKVQLAKLGSEGKLELVAEDLSDAPFSIVAIPRSY